MTRFLLSALLVATCLVALAMLGTMLYLLRASLIGLIVLSQGALALTERAQRELLP